MTGQVLIVAGVRDEVKQAGKRERIYAAPEGLTAYNESYPALRLRLRAGLS